MDKKVSSQTLTGYTRSSGINYIRLHMKKFNLLMNTYVSDSLSFFQKAHIIIDFAYCVIRYGAGINDYFQYRFYFKGKDERGAFITGRKWKHIVRVCNKQISQPSFDDKAKFNSTFSEYLGREWIDLDSCDLEGFISFTNKHPRSLYKMKLGSGGNGIHLYHSGSLSDRTLDFESMKCSNAILEEFIEQHMELAAFNPSSVNTLRLVTIVYNDEVKLMNAVLRMGNGDGCTDNFHHYGLAALIDIETGVVITPAVDKKNCSYEVHPESKKQIVGFRIPCWDKVVNTVIQAAKVEAGVRYVGWDVALKMDGTVCIIEGNCASDPDIIQIPDQIGKWPQYKKVITEIQTSR